MDPETTIETTATDSGSDYSAALESMIAQLESAPANAEPVTETVPAPVPVPEPAAVSAVSVAPVVTPAVDEKLEKTWAKIAERESKLAEERNALEAERRKLTTLSSQFRRNPVEALKALGFEDSEVGEVLRAGMASVLPQDKVPQQYRELQARLQQEDRFRTLAEENAKVRAELDSYRNQVEQQKHLAAYQDQARTYLTSAENEAPHVARLFASNSQVAMDRVLSVVRADAAKKLEAHNRGELTGPIEPMSPAEAARVVEAELAALAPLYAPKTTTPAQPKNVPSLSNKSVAPAASRSVSSPTKSHMDQVEDWLKANGLAH